MEERIDKYHAQHGEHRVQRSNETSALH